MVQVVRTLIVTIVLAALIVGGYVQLRTSADDRLIAELEALNAEMAARLEEKERMIDRMSRSRRLAHVEVGAQSLDGTGAVASTTLELVELDDRGCELGRQEFTLPGNVVYVDTLTVRFDPQDVAAGHPLRGRTLVLLRRVFSEQLAPADGFEIDTPGAAPAYATTEASTFEAGVWTHFWEIAADAELAARMGVRVAQGEAVYKPMKTGERYELSVDAIGGVTLVPLAMAASGSASGSE